MSTRLNPEIQADRGRRPARSVGGRIAARLVLLATMTALAVPLIGAPIAKAGTTIFVTTTNQEINDDGACSLQEAIYAANRDASTAPDPVHPNQDITTGCPAGSGHDTIELPPMGVFNFTLPINDRDNYIGPTVTPIITSDITIEGRGAKLERLAAGSRLTRAFAVGPTGFLDLREVHVKGFSIRGGDGGVHGGGGGMGGGGAIYVQGGSLLVQWSTFEANGVRGGDGGDAGDDNGGGGGGLSGNGGVGETGGGGGGGGSRGDGGDARVDDVDYFGGGGGGRVTSATNETPGEPCGAAGGESIFAVASDGDSAAIDCPGGGGGGGSGSSDIGSGDGGSGSYGGGGGGGDEGLLSAGNGGDGGFGGGGGGSKHNAGGDGGFGGGGGSGHELINGPGTAGTFGGDGGRFTGGGGAGLGGAIFGYLADIHVINSTFAGNVAAQGHGHVVCGLGECFVSHDGRGAGGAIFTVAGDLRVESSTFSGNSTQTVTNGGGGAIVVYDPEGNDEATLVLRNTILANNGASECYTRNGVDTGGSLGNIMTNTAPNNLGNPPCPGVAGGLTQSDDPGLGPLQLDPPGRTPTMAIGASSNAINAAVGTIPLDDQRGTLRPQGLAGDIGAYEYEVPDPVPPVTHIAFTPSTPNGSNNWYKTAVGVSITASDLDDVVAETRCAVDPASAPATFDDLVDPCPLVVPSDGQHTIYAASRDVGGNIESPAVSASLKIDGTAPALAPSLNVTTVSLGQTGVVASANATDATSGVASQGCDPVDTSTPGAHSVSCSATDNAGNTATASLSYTIEYRILGFFSPVPSSKWRVLQTVPVKVALANGAGVRISDAEAAALAAACQVKFEASGAQSKGPECMKYDAVMDQFVYNWRLGRNGVGAALIVVRISYPGTTVTTSLSEAITIMR